MLKFSCVKIGDNLNYIERKKILNLIYKYKDCFAEKMSELGETNAIEMNIKIKDSNKIINQKPNRVPYHLREKLENIVFELLENNIIEHSTSSYASRAHLVPKKDGEFRMVVDYRELNKITVREVFPMANIEENINQLRDNKLFIVLDMMNGYHQVPINESSRHLTGFVTPSGHYQYKRMPFGLTNAPAVFMRLVDLIIRNTKNKNIIAYMDDIVLFGKDFNELFNLFESFLITCLEMKITFKLKKCEFFVHNITYLGHIITDKGIYPGEVKIQAIVNYRRPVNVREVKQFLGLTGYFRKFVENYAVIAYPLNQLLRNNVEFIWGTNEETAFQNLKKKLSEKPVLVIYNPDQDHELHTDACQTGLAGVLIQVCSLGFKRPVAYFSRQTSSLEQKYHSYELETLAVVESMERFRFYLLGKHFKVITDCNSLKDTANKQNIIPRIARWWLRIQEFDFECIHRPGTQMTHADALSRNPYENAGDVDVAGCDMLIIGMNETDWIATIQRQDNSIKEIIERLESEKNDNTRKNLEKEYVLKNNRLFKKTKDGIRFVVPCGLRWRVIKSSHDDVGHSGFERTLARVKKMYWFPKMRKVISKYIDSCIQCLYNRRSKDETNFNIYPIEKCAIPFYTIHIDHVGPFPKSRKGNQYILGIIDSFSKFIILRPVRNTTSKAVIQTLLDISQFVGIPSQIISDRGSSFTSRIFKSFCEENGIKHILTAVRTPRANGQIERYFRTVNVALSSMTNNEDGSDWDQHVLAIQWGINSVKHKITQETPQRLLFTFTPRNYLGNQLSIDLHEDIEDDEDDIPLNELKRIVKERIDNEGNKVAENFNKKHRLPKQYAEGDLVLIKSEHPSTGQSRKLLARFKGPYVIKKILGNDRYLITDTTTSQVNQRKFESVQAADKIKPWCSLDEFMEAQEEGENGVFSSDDDE